MYLDEYKRWLAADLDDADLKPELAKIEGNDDEIKDRFAVALKFGTAGLRGVLGAGTNRMNIYVVRQATQGLANWVSPAQKRSRISIADTKNALAGVSARVFFLHSRNHRAQISSYILSERIRRENLCEQYEAR